MKLYRAHLIGLPIQRSTFREIDRAPSLIGLNAVLPDDRLGAELNESGDLLLDRSNVDVLAEALRSRLSAQFLCEMERSLHAACETLSRATDHCRNRAAAASAAEARRLLAELSSALSVLVPFGILSKFVPDLLNSAFESSFGTRVSGLAMESPGAALTREAFGLFNYCKDTGLSPLQLLSDWPAVPPRIMAAILAFCEKHAGFGALPWEATGYEDPRYVLGVLNANFGACDRDVAALRLLRTTQNVGPPLRTPSPGPDMFRDTLERVIAAWADFLERETWYVRRAFYLALLPLLRIVFADEAKQNPRLVQEDLLFFDLDDLVTGSFDLEAARSRRASYFERSAYLSDNAIGRDRLAALFNTPCSCPTRTASAQRLT